MLKIQDILYLRSGAEMNLLLPDVNFYFSADYSFGQFGFWKLIWNHNVIEVFHPTEYDYTPSSQITFKYIYNHSIIT